MIPSICNNKKNIIGGKTMDANISENNELDLMKFFIIENLETNEDVRLSLLSIGCGEDESC